MAPITAPAVTSSSLPEMPTAPATTRKKRITAGTSRTSPSISQAPNLLPQEASGIPIQPCGRTIGCCQPPGGTGPP